MKNRIVGILTDASPSANSSTSREVEDLLKECSKHDVKTVVFHPSSSKIDKYHKADYEISCWSIFYKSDNLVLRFVSEIMISVCLTARYWVTRRRYERISTLLWISPSVFNVLPALVIKKMEKSRLYLMLRDVFPFWLADVGILNPQNTVFRGLKKIADIEMRIADTIGVESDVSKRSFLKLYPEYSYKTEVLRNWITVKTRRDTDKTTGGDKVRLIYAGNIGKAQGTEYFKALIKWLSSRTDAEVHLVGRGDAIKELESVKTDGAAVNFILHRPMSSSEIDKFVAQFDIGLVFLRHELNASNIPGKAMWYLMNGLPIFGAINPGNELSVFVKDNGVGRVDVSGCIDEFLYQLDLMLTEYKNDRYRPFDIQKKSQEYFSVQTAYHRIMRDQD